MWRDDVIREVNHSTYVDGERKIMVLREEGEVKRSDGEVKENELPELLIKLNAIA